MLDENVSPAADQPDSRAVGQPLVTLVNKHAREGGAKRRENEDNKEGKHKLKYKSRLGNSQHA
eukprot:1156110-Pelagomonas_calceolata.AAC.4